MGASDARVHEPKGSLTLCPVCSVNASAPATGRATANTRAVEVFARIKQKV